MNCNAMLASALSGDTYCVEHAPQQNAVFNQILVLRLTNVEGGAFASHPTAARTRVTARAACSGEAVPSVIRRQTYADTENSVSARREE
jgi:hypothetical protein